MWLKIRFECRLELDEKYANLKKKSFFFFLFFWAGNLLRIIIKVRVIIIFDLLKVMSRDMGNKGGLRLGQN